MYFPSDVFREILSFIPTPYRKPPHLDAFNNIEAYRQLLELQSNPEYQEDINNPELYMHSSLYRFIMDDLSFRRRGCGLESKWNPFMATYCERMITSSPWFDDLIDLGFGDKRRSQDNNNWGSEHHYKLGLVRDFSVILDHLRDNESVAWWF